MTALTDPRSLAAFRKPPGQAFQRGAWRYQPVSLKLAAVVAIAAFLAGAASTVFWLAAGIEAQSTTTQLRSAR